MLPFSAPQIELLAALLDQIVPPDGDPGAVDAGALNYLAQHPGDYDHMRVAIIMLEGTAYLSLRRPEQRIWLDQNADHPSIQRLIVLTIEAYYAGVNSAGAKMVGFRVTA